MLRVRPLISMYRQPSDGALFRVFASDGGDSEACVAPSPLPRHTPRNPLRMPRCVCCCVTCSRFPPVS